MTMSTERKGTKRESNEKSLHRLRQRRYHPPARGGKISLGFDSSWNLESGTSSLARENHAQRNRKKKTILEQTRLIIFFFFLFTVKVHIRSRVVTVEGPRGKLVKDLSHIAVTFGRPEKDIISIELHHGARKGVATLRTVRTIINNLIIGVTRGFLYKMRYVYAHFPINVNIEKNAETGGTDIEIRNFLGEKYVRRVSARPGVDIVTSPNVKDELQLSGNSLEDVSQSAADIQQICRVRNKDIRKVSF